MASQDDPSIRASTEDRVNAMRGFKAYVFSYKLPFNTFNVIEPSSSISNIGMRD
jgi:hypothetical protein